MRAAIAACGHPKNLHDPYKLSLRDALGVGPACWAAIAAYNLQVTDSLSLLSLLMVWFLPLGLPAELPLAIRRQEAGTGPWGSHQNFKKPEVASVTPLRNPLGIRPIELSELICQLGLRCLDLRQHQRLET